jgi:hypothetical protein
VQADCRGIIVRHGFGGKILTLAALDLNMCKARLTADNKRRRRKMKHTIAVAVAAQMATRRRQGVLLRPEPPIARRIRFPAGPSFSPK